jgi:hypothetical protein
VQCSPFCRRDDLDNAGLHAVAINLVDEPLEVAKLVHGLGVLAVVPLGYNDSKYSRV